LKKKDTEKLLNWDAHYVGIKATKERQRNCITLDELAKEVMPLLFPYVRTTIEDQIPVFTVWAANNSKSCIKLRKKNSLNKQKGLEVSSWLIIVTGLIYAYIGIEQAFKGNMPMAVVYTGYAFSNIGLYLLAK
jgi:hypothetical protein